jgi:hypothetical protein
VPNLRVEEDLAGLRSHLGTDDIPKRPVRAEPVDAYWSTRARVSLLRGSP